MSRHAPTTAGLDEWIAREAVAFSLDAAEPFNSAVDAVVASLGGAVELLGFGEPLHSAEEILMLRNRLFQRLVEVHGYTAIAIEGSSLPSARLVNDYIAGRGPDAYEQVRDVGFGVAFGGLEANRELVEWMRSYNADPGHAVKLRFYGFDLPAGSMGTASPRQSIEFVLDYLASIAGPVGEEHRRRIAPLLGQDSEWENPAAWGEVGLSANAVKLRIALEDLISELQIERPELVAQSDEDRYLEALRYATMARQLLNFSAAMARHKGDLPVVPLGIRDAMMADNLAYLARRERGRGKVLAFAHNAHLQRGKAVWPGAGPKFTWWPAGAHLSDMLGSRYAVIGSAVGVSEASGIGQPEAGSLEARLTAAGGPVRFIPTHRGEGFAATDIAALPPRSSSTKNPTYSPLAAQSLSDFDWLAVLDSVEYARGGWPLPEARR